ncbi:MAG TPA: AMP-binding protein [Ilumatobacteraceae bacterium]|nr:AMP-binding protein [Ilumatobacteraceae bacterium]
MSAALSIAGLLRERIGDERPGYAFESQQWSWDDVVRESAVRAAVLDALLAGPPDEHAPRHVGVLLENVPEYLFLAGGAAFTGVTLVGINPTRRGAELAGDIGHTRCRLVITDAAQAPLLPLDVPIVVVDSAEYATLLATHAGAELPATDPDPMTPLFLLFTSGSTTAPKAVVCTTSRMARTGIRAAEAYGVTRADVCYCCMPLFHGNALMACWAPALAVGATVALRRKFSASGFLPDIRRHRCTYFTYVGRTIAYILATEPTAKDRDHVLRLGFGTEASALDRERFATRFGCPLVEGYGSSESAVSIMRTPDTPANALGRPRPDDGSDIAVVDPSTCIECARARFDEHGALANGHDAIGELVNRRGVGSFEGYFENDEATTERLRNGWYWTGDLAYRDADGFFYFAGRTADWLRVDGENFSTAPVERILHRFAGCVMVAAYAVPDPRTGDQVMAAVEMAPGHTFDPGEFVEFLAAQHDLGTKWAPRFVRVIDSMPLTANNKVNKQPLRAEAWRCTDPVWWRPAGDATYRLLTAGDRAALDAELAQHGVRP